MLKQDNLHKRVVTGFQQEGPHSNKAELSVTNEVNTLLSSSLVNIKRHCWLNAEYSRQEYLDIVGIPGEVEADALEKKLVAILEKLAFNIPTERIAACHGVSEKNRTVIVKLSRRKEC